MYDDFRRLSTKFWAQFGVSITKPVSLNDVDAASRAHDATSYDTEVIFVFVVGFVNEVNSKVVTARLWGVTHGRVREQNIREKFLKIIMRSYDKSLRVV